MPVDWKGKDNILNLRELQSALEEFIFIAQAHKMGVFNELCNKPDSSAGLARRLYFDERSTWILLEALTEMRYLAKDGDLYSVPLAAYERLVNENGDNYEGDFWQFLFYLMNPWRTLPYVLKHGEPDKSSYRDFSMRDFIYGMDSPWKKKTAPEVVDVCLRHCPRAGVVADIGGAPGTIARVFASRGLRTLVYDLPESNAVRGEELSKIKNIEVLSGDATVSLPAGPYDIAFLGNLCHGQSPDDNEKIIRMCHENLSEKGIIAVFDNLRGESRLGARLALHMLTQSPKGNIYTREEYTAWMEKAGFRSIQVEALSDRAWQMVIGYKKN